MQLPSFKGRVVASRILAVLGPLPDMTALGLLVESLA
jgi:hypothetical protein